MLARKKHDPNADDECGCRNATFLDKNMSANEESQVECDVNQ